MNPLALFMLAIGGYLAFILPVQIWRDWRRHQGRSGRVLGLVIGHEQGGTMHHKMEHFPPTQHARIRYHVNGQDYECVASSGVSWKHLHRLKQRVMMAYNPNDPSDADTLSFTAHPLFLVITCGLCAVTGLVILWFVPQVWSAGEFLKNW